MSEKRKNKIVLVTGATKGLGKLLTQHFTDLKYQVVGTDLVQKEDVPDELKSIFAEYYTFDLRKLSEIPSFLEEVFSKHDIDVVVNNAGILDFRYMEEYSDQEIIDTIDVNLISVMLIIKNILPYFIRKKFGRIINISSNSAYRGFETGTLYTPTKAGINLLTESVGNELMIMQQKSDFDITINAVCPSRIDTEEFIQSNPEVNRKKLISSHKIFKEIDRLIETKRNGQIVLLFSSKYKFHYLKQKLLVESIRLLFK